jgi:Flp pilus assembly protein TadG
VAPPPTPVRRRAKGGQSGQTLAIFVVFMIAILGMAAFAIDAGTWYQDRRHLQADADAAALAGAANFTLGTATTTAQANFAKNKLTGETATVTTPAYDTIKVTTNYTAPSFFAKVFGRNSAALSATATARIQGLGGVKNHVSPYVVTEASYANGTGTTLFNCDANGQCGTVDLPTSANTTGGSCSGPVYSGITGNVQAALSGANIIGEVDIGGCLSPKTGNAQPSANTVNNLAGSMAQDLQSLGNGQYQIIPQSWDDANGIPPRLIFVPIVPAFGTGTNATMVVSNFAWFYMTGATGNGNGLKINGVYVSVTMPPLNGGSTAWVPGRVGQVTFVSLTG